MPLFLVYSSLLPSFCYLYDNNKMAIRYLRGKRVGGLELIHLEGTKTFMYCFSLTAYVFDPFVVLRKMAYWAIESLASCKTIFTQLETHEAFLIVCVEKLLDLLFLQTYSLELGVWKFALVTN